MSKRQISSRTIKQAVSELCLTANTSLREDVLSALERSREKMDHGTPPADMTGILLENAGAADREKVPLCQDTGLVSVFMDIGYQVSLNGDITRAVNQGVAEAYVKGGLRRSIVKSPVNRVNTDDNTPCIVHYDLVPGDRVRIQVIAKGFGSENKSRVGMLSPTDGPEDIANFCVETVKLAGPDACPPYFLGVGIGGSMDWCPVLAKKAFFLPMDREAEIPYIRELEQKIKQGCDRLDIGIMGLGEGPTVLGVRILEQATHIAGLPVAVNICCHALRTAEQEI